MNTPLAIPAYPSFASMVWRAITGLPVVRTLRELAAERRALSSAARDTDPDVDTSLTQAHLEILK